MLASTAATFAPLDGLVVFCALRLEEGVEVEEEEDFPPENELIPNL